MIRTVTSRAALAALSLSMLGMVAIDTKPADAAVVCGPRGCIARPGVNANAAYVAPLARARIGGPVGVGRVGVGVGRVGVGRNMGGPVNRVGRR